MPISPPPPRRTPPPCGRGRPRHPSAAAGRWCAASRGTTRSEGTKPLGDSPFRLFTRTQALDGSSVLRHGSSRSTRLRTVRSPPMTTTRATVRATTVLRVVDGRQYVEVHCSEDLAHPARKAPASASVGRSGRARWADAGVSPSHARDGTRAARAGASRPSARATAPEPRASVREATIPAETAFGPPTTVTSPTPRSRSSATSAGAAAPASPSTTSSGERRGRGGRGRDGEVGRAVPGRDPDGLRRREGGARDLAGRLDGLPRGRRGPRPA